MTSKKGIDSHIQMPKFMLKRFHNSKNKFFYYDVQQKHIGTNGTANSTNTKNDYYSSEAEGIFNAKVETPFSKLLEQVDSLDYENYIYDVPKEELRRECIGFIYALMSRDPLALNAAKQNSYTIDLFPEREQHDYIAVVGIDIAYNEGLFSEYDATILVNRTDTPFVLPIAGTYSCVFKECTLINLPISPKLAICLVDKEYANKQLLHDGNITFLYADKKEIIESMNERAFRAQMDREWGRIVCPEKQELQRLEEKVCSNSSLEECESTV